MASLGMALALVRDTGQLSTLAPRLAPLLSFSDLLEIETALSEIQTDLPVNETALFVCIRRQIDKQIATQTDFWTLYNQSKCELSMQCLMNALHLRHRSFAWSTWLTAPLRPSSTAPKGHIKKIISLSMFIVHIYLFCFLLFLQLPSITALTGQISK